MRRHTARAGQTVDGWPRGAGGARWTPRVPWGGRSVPGMRPRGWARNPRHSRSNGGTSLTGSCRQRHRQVVPRHGVSRRHELDDVGLCRHVDASKAPTCGLLRCSAIRPNGERGKGHNDARGASATQSPSAQPRSAGAPSRTRDRACGGAGGWGAGRDLAPRQAHGTKFTPACRVCGLQRRQHCRRCGPRCAAGLT